MNEGQNTIPCCSCYDEDCYDVKDPLACWMGDEWVGLADGYCPLLRSNSEKEDEDVQTATYETGQFF